jgi:predicted nucleic acid-binding protein
MLPAPFKVVLDACVIYPFLIRDVLLEAAAKDCYQVCWSEMILDEAFRNLIKNGRITEEKAARLAATMRRAFPDAQVTEYEDLIPSMQNDEKDRHVVAAAVKAGAQVIVTANMRDFRKLPSGVEAQTPDDFLSNLFDLQPSRMIGVLETIARRYQTPPMTIPEILEALDLYDFSALVRGRLASR